MPKKPKRSINSGRLLRKEPLWKGPEVEGITQSLIGSYLECKERFRVRTVTGLGPEPRLNIFIYFGNLWHEAEEKFAAGEDWETAVKRFAVRASKRWIQDRDKVEKWYNVVKTTFPIYMDYWKDDADVKKRKPIYQEVNFKVPMLLPSGRTIILRGKWDAVDSIGGKVFLQENKTKTTVDEFRLQKQLTYDLQTMLYLVALQEHFKGKKKIGGVRYNVIRRPLGGGKGSIRPHKKFQGTGKPEPMSHFWKRLGSVIEAEVDSFFYRWKVEVSHDDLNKFKQQTLIPILENIADDYEWWSHCHTDKRASVFNGELRHKLYPHHCPRHYRQPYGVYSSLAQGLFTDVDDYLNTGSTVGLHLIPSLFPELE